MNVPFAALGIPYAVFALLLSMLLTLLGLKLMKMSVPSVYADVPRRRRVFGLVTMICATFATGITLALALIAFVIILDTPQHAQEAFALGMFAPVLVLTVFVHAHDKLKKESEQSYD